MEFLRRHISLFAFRLRPDSPCGFLGAVGPWDGEFGRMGSAGIIGPMFRVKSRGAIGGNKSKNRATAGPANYQAGIYPDLKKYRKIVAPIPATWRDKSQKSLNRIGYRARLFPYPRLPD